MITIIKKLTVFLVIFFILIEFFSFIASKYELLVKNETPALYGGVKIAESVRFNRTEEKPWGAWRRINHKSKQVSSCFNVNFITNEIGARDSSFENINSNSIFLLGDSFAEGFGVDIKKTTQYFLEKKLNIDILNFGTSQTFGPLQELIIYKEYKNKYKHNGIIVFILPANDFSDNDQLHWARIDKTRYRPYFNLEGDPLVPYYFPEAKKASFDFQNPDLKMIILEFLKDNLWLTNTIRSIRALLMYSSSNEKIPGYFRFTENSLNKIKQINLIKSYTEIARLSDGNDVLFVTIPSQAGINYYKNTKKPNLYKKSIWYKEFNNLSKKKNIFYLDLMESIPNNHDELFLECDGHWSEKGNKWASEEIFKLIKKNNIFNKRD